MRTFGWPLRFSFMLLTMMAVTLPSRSPACASDQYVFEHEFVLGTSLQIQVDADSSAAAQAAESRVLAEIQRLEKIYSRHNVDSELARWQSSLSEAVPVSDELRQILAASDRWQLLSHGAFNPAVESASLLWKQAEQKGQPPAAEELARVIERIRQPQWVLNETTKTATHLAAGPLTLDAIAKGTILDRSAQAALSGFPEVRGIIINIGGDLRIAGDTVSPVQITDPFHDALNAKPLCSIYVHNQGVATSGGYRRSFQVAEKSYSHIIDPRTASPVEQFASVTVVARDAETADALATTFSVLSANECLALVTSLSEVEFLLMTHTGERIVSPGWEELQQPRLFRLADATQSSTTPKDSPLATETGARLLELEVNFELAQPAGAQYRRPYLALWLEDADGFPVRTAALWMTTKQPGPRWHRDLLRWYRNDRTRKLSDQKELIGVISEATRGPGKYKVVFDGNDDAGDPLKPGKYTLYLEVVREHGTYQLISHPLEIGTEPIAKVKLKSNAEIKSASVEYRQPTSATGKSESK